MCNGVHFMQIRSENCDYFDAAMGSEAVFDLLPTIDLQAEMLQLKEDIAATGSDTKLKRLTNRLKLAEAFLASGNPPEWTVMTVLPVLRPELRHLPPLTGGRLATAALPATTRPVLPP